MYQPTKVRLSHNALDLLHTCERKFQIERFLMPTNLDLDEEKTENVHFIFGRAFGAAIAVYLQTQDMDQALYTLLLEYTPWIDQEDKSFWKAAYGLLAQQNTLDEFLAEWEVVEFKGQPAVELGIRLNIDNVYYHAGYIDLVMRHKVTGKYAVIEAKSTKFNLSDVSPLYKNSGQALGYSIALDAIVGEELSSYDVVYIVLQYPNILAIEPRIHIFVWPKTLLDRLQWFMTLKMDVAHLETMFELNHFPKRGDSCIKFNKPCPHFNICHMHSLDKYKPEEPDPHEAKYTFRYELDDLITDHIQRVQEHSA